MWKITSKIFIDVSNILFEWIQNSGLAFVPLEHIEQIFLLKVKEADWLMGFSVRSTEFWQHTDTLKTLDLLHVIKFKIF